jgi:hypothetical protein
MPFIRFSPAFILTLLLPLAAQAQPAPQSAAPAIHIPPTVVRHFVRRMVVHILMV